MSVILRGALGAGLSNTGFETVRQVTGREALTLRIAFDA